MKEMELNVQLLIYTCRKAAGGEGPLCLLSIPMAVSRTSSSTRFLLTVIDPMTMTIRNNVFVNSVSPLS